MWAFLVKLPLGECHRTSLMINHHWFRWLVPSSNKQLMAKYLMPYGITWPQWVQRMSILYLQYVPPKSAWTPQAQKWTPPTEEWTYPQSEWTPPPTWTPPPPPPLPTHLPSNMDRLIEMGFADREQNQSLLDKHENDLEKVVQELVQGMDNEWYESRH